MYLLHCDIKQRVELCRVDVEDISLTRQDEKRRQHTVETLTILQLLRVTTKDLITQQFSMMPNSTHVSLRLSTIPLTVLGQTVLRQTVLRETVLRETVLGQTEWNDRLYMESVIPKCNHCHPAF